MSVVPERDAGAGLDVRIVDYGAGNVASVVKGLRAVGATTQITAKPSEIAGADAIVIPGVGHFSATETLGEPWRRVLREHLQAGVPLLGICLGMQWLFEGSEEAPALEGLGVLPGRCFRLERVGPAIKIPHVGWNALDRVNREGHASRLLTEVPSGSAAYFTHTFAAPVVDATVATTSHGSVFAAAVEHGSVFGVQFHPEKSGKTGLRILANFLTVAREARAKC